MDVYRLLNAPAASITARCPVSYEPAAVVDRRGLPRTGEADRHVDCGTQSQPTGSDTTCTGSLELLFRTGLDRPSPT
jgi:hypothetical protein